MKNNVTFLKKGKNQIAVIQEKHLAGQGDFATRKDSAPITMINDYDEQVAKTGDNSGSLHRHNSTESQQRTHSSQGLYPQKQNLHEHKLKQIIRIQQSQLQGKNLLNMSQQNPLNNSKKLNVHQIRFNKDSQQRFASINHSTASNNQSANMAAHGSGLSMSNNVDQKSAAPAGPGLNPVKNLGFKGLKISEVAQ